MTIRSNSAQHCLAHSSSLGDGPCWKGLLMNMLIDAAIARLTQSMFFRAGGAHSPSLGRMTKTLSNNHNSMTGANPTWAIRTFIKTLRTTLPLTLTALSQRSSGPSAFKAAPGHIDPRLNPIRTKATRNAFSGGEYIFHSSNYISRAD